MSSTRLVPSIADILDLVSQDSLQGCRARMPAATILMAHPVLASLGTLPDWILACDADLSALRDLRQASEILHSHNIYAEPRDPQNFWEESPNTLFMETIWGFLGYTSNEGKAAWLSHASLSHLEEARKREFLAQWRANAGVHIGLHVDVQDFRYVPRDTISALPIHEQTLEVYVRAIIFGEFAPHVIKEENFRPHDRKLIELIPSILEEARCWMPRNDWTAPDGYRFFCCPSDNRFIAIREVGTGLLVGGIAHHATWVAPKDRGKGLGRLLVEYGDRHGSLNPAYFSIAGFRTRLSAHRHALIRARQNGERIPAAVMNDYTETPDGNFILSDPRWMRVIEDAQNAPPYSRTAETNGP